MSLSCYMIFNFNNAFISQISICSLFYQLENTMGGGQVYQQRVTQHLVPCVGQFSVALADDSLWKTLNYQVLIKTRHSDAKVRTAAHSLVVVSWEIMGLL